MLVPSTARTSDRWAALTVLPGQATHDVGPVDLGREEHHDVGRERHAQPLDDPFDGREGAQCHGEGDAATRQRRPERSRPGVQQLLPRSDRHQVGREVERVGTDQGDEGSTVTAMPLVPNFACARAPRLLSVARRVRSQISCTAIVSGSVTGTAQSMLLPNVAQA